MTWDWEDDDGTEFAGRPAANTGQAEYLRAHMEKMEPAVPTQRRTTQSVPQRQTPAPSRPLRVAVELGHGGRDPGALRNGVVEAQIVRSIAPWLNQLSGDGVVYDFCERGATRLLTPLKSMLRRDTPDIVISLHVNSAGSKKRDNPKPHGATIYYDPKHKASATLAQLVQREVTPHEQGLSSTGAPPQLGTWPYSRPDDSDYYYPLHDTGRHAMVQVEMGFVTSPDDRFAMPTRGFAQQTAVQLDRAIRAFTKQQHLSPPASESPSVLGLLRGPQLQLGNGPVAPAPAKPRPSWSSVAERRWGPNPLEPTPPMPSVRRP